MARRVLWSRFGAAEQRSAGGRFQLCRVKLPGRRPTWHLYDRGAYVYHGYLKDAKDEAERRNKAPE